MRKYLVMLLGACALIALAANKGYDVGDEARDFNLKNVDGKMMSLSQFKDAKGFTVIFTCNHCPYAKAYEDRIIALQKEYGKDYPVIAINPNDPVAYPSDNFESMQVRAEEKGFNFPYLMDETQEIAKTYGAAKTPHVYLLKKEEGKLIVKYIGAIDDNYSEPEKVKHTYLADAIKDLQAGKDPQVAKTFAIGCSIKWKK